MNRNDAEDRSPAPDAHVSERLDAYRTGELDETARARVEAHLAGCELCRHELAELATWTAAIERGYEARRAGSEDLEPDWAAQRAAIVARTSGRARAGERSGAFRRWGPQIALVAVAALIVGIVWRENPREQPTRTPTAETGPAVEESGMESDPARRGTAAVGAVEGEDAPGRDEARSRRADAPAPTDEPAAAAPPAVPADRIAQENDRALEKQAGREPAEDARERREALADRMAEPSPAAGLADLERFEREARVALEARDTTAARRALSLWSDTLAPRGVLGGQRVSLADSLREFLETAE
jgi:hypothetical protein